MIYELRIMIYNYTLVVKKRGFDDFRKNEL